MTVQHDRALDVALGKYTVYKHTSPTGKVYVGLTRGNLQRRWKGGYGYVKNTHFFRAIQMYGWNAFKHEVMASGLTEAEAIEKEKELIALYDSTNPSKGYNRDPGGGVRSLETSAKISATLTGVPLSLERRRHLSEIRKGRPLSEARKHQISESHKNNPKVQAHIRKLNASRAGQPKTPEHRQKIAESQPRRREVVNLGTGEVFKSVRDAAASCGGSHPNIVKACTGKRETAYGYRWAYKEVTKICS
jgi:group I intron endonuclease